MTVRPGYISDGNDNWIQIGPAVPVGSTVYYQASEPSSPQTGDIWIDADNDVPSIDNSQFLRWRKTVSGGETSLSGLDDSGLSLQYTPAYEQVYLNGVLLVRGQDYTATTGTSITGLTALAASDVVEVFSVVARVVGDVYTQSQTNSLLDAKSNVSSTGLVLLNTTNVTAAATITVDNIFTSSYANYKIIFDYDMTTTNGLSYIQFRTSGTTNSNANYNSQYVAGYGGSFYADRMTNQTSARIVNTNGDQSYASIDIYAPALAKHTGGYSTFGFGGVGTGIENNSIYFGFANTTQFDGFIITGAGNITGTIKIYGYK